MDSANSKYNDYVQYISQMDTAPVADRYTSAIYGARDYVNSRVSSLMARDDVQYAKSISDQISQQVSLNQPISKYYRLFYNNVSPYTSSVT